MRLTKLMNEGVGLLYWSLLIQFRACSHAFIALNKPDPTGTHNIIFAELWLRQSNN